MAIQNKDLQNTLAAIEKEFGQGSIMQLGDATNNEVTGISTGSLSLDIALGGKGLPRGRIVEIYGNESSGKTTIALHAVANAQKGGGVAAYIDAEHALDPTWAKRIGVDLESLLVSQPAYGEEALRIAEMLVKSNAVDIIVIDSVAALVPKNEAENEIGEPSMGQQARLMSQALRILNADHRQDADVHHLHQPDPPEDRRHVRQPGDHDRRAGAQVLCLLPAGGPPRAGRQGRGRGDRHGSEGEGGEEQGRPAVPHRRVRAAARPRHQHFSDLVNIAVDCGALEKSGSFFSYNDQRLGQGKENVKQFLTENTGLADEIRAKVLEIQRAKAGVIGGEAVPEEDEGAEPEPIETTKDRKKK